MKQGRAARDTALVREIHACFDKAAVKAETTQHSEIQPLIRKAQSLAIEIKDSVEQVSYLNWTAQVCHKLSLETLGLEIAHKALDCVEFNAKTALDDQWGIAEENAKTIRACGFAELGPTLVKLGQSKQGFGLLNQAYELWDSLTGDIDGREIALAQIAYDYGELGLEDKAMAIANHLPNHRYDFYIFEPLCQLYLERSDHQRLVKMINARDRLFMQDWEQHWQQFQGGLWHDHNIHQLVQLCSEQNRHDYPLHILSELASARAKVNLLASLARIKFAEKRQEEALMHLGQADQISHQISDPRLRQALRQLVAEVLSYWSIGSG